ncbi:MAG: laccase domain-containing protein, partial [Methylobacillus glycogenes]|nr:laccase domain-containing protein [Methylobacillus glycogenes]
PVLFCDRAGSVVAAAHAGWRGLAAGVLEATIDKMDVPASELLAWLGPAIGPNCFEVGDDVRTAFLDKDPAAAIAFAETSSGKWLADIYTLARQRLVAAGVNSIDGGEFCTFTEAERFFSYRRDGVTGRMASLIWLDRQSGV